jgi:hypothetical protein
MIGDALKSQCFENEIAEWMIHGVNFPESQVHNCYYVPHCQVSAEQ